MQQLVVTAAIIERGDDILITQRKVGTSQGLLWEFPGGKVRFGEDPRACLAREIREELGSDLEVGPLFTVASHVYDDDRHIILIVYRCRLRGGEPRPLDCHAVAWIRPGEL
ncbi:MAG: (deoxy)nucleoside triphosphate pyrophosphohydrolase, partial [Chloroflexota bacterium]